MNWQDERVFVTGASGLLGAELVAQLTARGAAVTCLVRDRLEGSRLHDVLHNGVYGDVRDRQLMQRVLAEYEVSTVFHLAAQPIVSVAWSNPLEAFDVNAMGTVSLLEACRAIGVVRTVVASTDKVYGITSTPCDEQAPLLGRSPYEASKVCTDIIAQSYAAQYDMAVGIARCGNLYGPGDLNFSRLIPGTIRSIIRDQAVVVRSDGSPVHDYFWVGDAAGAYICLAEHLEHPGTQIFNFGGGYSYDVRSVVEAIRMFMGDSRAVQYLCQKTKEIPYQALILDKARTLLGWQPTTKLPQGLRSTIDWYRKYFS